MCGIVGLYTKTEALRGELGAHLAAMLIEMSERGPDSAGIAVYRNPVAGETLKLSLFHPAPDFDWARLAADMGRQFGAETKVEVRGSHAVIVTRADLDAAQRWLASRDRALRIMSAGHTIEIFKEMGRPRDVAQRFRLYDIKGTHAIGHTRMATESAVTTEHSHPFSTGLDLCLVHNGSLSNHNRLREELKREGIAFKTDNDTEVAAGYLTRRLREGASLKQALESSLKDLDGFFTFAVGTADGFAVLRDGIACKHAVLAETDDWVAMATEYRAIAVLPGADRASIWEPAPGRVYSWGRA
jgi:glutamate synthase domain-containing protein 1